MLFSNNGFGLTPMAPAASTERVGSSAAAAPVSTVGTTTATDVCTSDGKLIYIDGAWHVRSFADNDTACASTIASEDVNYIKNSGQPIYVGPFRLDLSTPFGAFGTNVFLGQITTLTNPAQMGKDWGQWFHDATTSMFRGYIAAREKAGKVVTARQLAIAQGTYSIANDPWPAPMAVGDVSYFVDTGASQRAASTPLPSPVPGKLASGGHSLYPDKVWYAPDANGHRTTYVQYDGDPNTYNFYSFGDWILALDNTYPDANYLTVNNTFNYTRNEDRPPIARFKHPITGADWGLWITVAAEGGADNDSLGEWNTSTDAPLGVVMQVALGPMPQEGWWDDFIDDILWIPTALGNALWDVATWIGGFVCDLQGSNQAALMKKVPPSPYAQAAALAAIEIANVSNCPHPPPPVDCKDPANANNAKCLNTKSLAPPWWKRWYVVLPILGIASYGIFKVIKNKKPFPRLAT